MLQKGADYIRQLRSERNQLRDEMDCLRQQIECLNTSIRYVGNAILIVVLFTTFFIPVIVNQCYLLLVPLYLVDVIAKCKICLTNTSEIGRWRTGNFGLYPLNLKYSFITY